MRYCPLLSALGEGLGGGDGHVPAWADAPLPIGAQLSFDLRLVGDGLLPLYRAHPTIVDTDSNDGLSNAPIAPLSLMAHPILAKLTNSYIAALNNLREVSPILHPP